MCYVEKQVEAAGWEVAAGIWSSELLAAGVEKRPIARTAERTMAVVVFRGTDFGTVVADFDGR